MAREEISARSLRRLAEVSEETEFNKPTGYSLSRLLKTAYGRSSRDLAEVFYTINPQLPKGARFRNSALTVKLFGSPYFSNRIPPFGFSLPVNYSCRPGQKCAVDYPERGLAFIRLKSSFNLNDGNQIAAELKQNDGLGIVATEARSEMSLVKPVSHLAAGACDSGIPEGSGQSDPIDPLSSLADIDLGNMAGKLADTVIAVIDSGISAASVDPNGTPLWDDRFTYWRNPIPGSVSDPIGSLKRVCISDFIGCNFVKADRDGDVRDLQPPDSDYFGHGTHVAGLATGYATKHPTVPRSKFSLMVLKVAKDNGNGTVDPDLLLLALDYAMSKREVRVINVSAVGPMSANMPFFLQYLRPDLLVVAAAGNSGKRLEDLPESSSFPAKLTQFSDQFATVAAVTGPELKLYKDSNFSGRLVTIAAPGVNVPSTFPGNGVRALCGTSQAAPIVSFAAALLFASRGFKTGAAVRRRLEVSSDFSPNLLNSVKWGGVLNVKKALQWNKDIVQLREIPPGGGSGSDIVMGDISLKDSIKLDPQSEVPASQVAKITFNVDEQHRDRVLVYLDNSSQLQEIRGHILNLPSVIIGTPDKRRIDSSKIREIVFREPSQ